MGHATERFLRLETIFHEALAVSGEARKELIASRCRDDKELAAEVRSLLRAGEAEERFAASCRVPEVELSSQLADKRFGPYQLDRLLGRGGMGAVYLAHRADGQFQQNVAIKLIDLPLATDLFRERFRQERQILAELQHPYIARLLDGGVTAEGDLSPGDGLRGWSSHPWSTVNGSTSPCHNASSCSCVFAKPSSLPISTSWSTAI